ncbi:16904_t:CDS:2, partial [Gigaspora rosea]
LDVNKEWKKNGSSRRIVCSDEPKELSRYAPEILELLSSGDPLADREKWHQVYNCLQKGYKYNKDQLRDPGKPGSTYFSTFLKKVEFIPEPYKPLLPSSLCKLGSVFASIVHNANNLSEQYFHQDTVVDLIHEIVLTLISEKDLKGNKNFSYLFETSNSAETSENHSRLKKFIKLVRGKQKPVYCSNVIHTTIIFFEIQLCPNIIHLGFKNSIGFSNKLLEAIAELYPKLKYLNLCDDQSGDYLRLRIRGVDNGGLRKITQSCHKLEYLNISYRTEIVERTILIACSCLNLKYLYLKRCDNTSKEAVDQLSPNIHGKNFVSTEILSDDFRAFVNYFLSQRNIRNSNLSIACQSLSQDIASTLSF